MNPLDHSTVPKTPHGYGVGYAENPGKRRRGDLERTARANLVPRAVALPARNGGLELQLHPDLLSPHAVRGVVDDWLVQTITEMLLQDLLSSKAEREGKE